MIRPVRPTDLVALVELYRRGFVNEAQAACDLVGRCGGRTRPGTFLEHWLSLEENRHTWISVRGRTVQGLISARSLAGSTAWEIDRLLFATGEQDVTVGISLLDYLSAVACEVGVHRLFLRLARDSAALEASRRAGFFPYTLEMLYGRQAVEPDRSLPPHNGVLALRRKGGGDEQALFRVYSEVVPGRVRQAEGLTLQEWRQARDKCLGQRRRQELVVEMGGMPVGWLHVVSMDRAGQFDLLVRPEAEAHLEYLLEYGLALLRGRSPVVCLVPEFQSRLPFLLETAGFEPVAEFYALVKQLAVRVRRPALVPARV